MAKKNKTTLPKGEGTRLTPKEFSTLSKQTEAAQRRKRSGGAGRTVSPRDVDVQTGRPRRLGEKYITDPLERLVAKIPPSMRVSEREAVPSTFESRMASIGRTGDRGLGGVAEGRREGGVVQVEKMRAGGGAGPSTPESPGGKKQKYRPRTAADVEPIPEKARRKLPAEVGGKFDVSAGPAAGTQTVERTEAAKKATVSKETGKVTPGTFGGFKAAGKKKAEPQPAKITPPSPAPGPKKPEIPKQKAKVKPKKKETLRMMIGRMKTAGKPSSEIQAAINAFKHPKRYTIEERIQRGEKKFRK